MSDLRTKLARAVSPELAAVLPPRQSDALIENWQGKQSEAQAPWNRPGTSSPITGTLQNPPDRPSDWHIRSGLAEAVSPTMGAFGVGQALGETAGALREREYGNALMSAGPLAAMAVMPGAPKGMQKPPIRDRLGYYSGALEAARNLSQAKGTPQQMLAVMQKSGAKAGEIEATGLNRFLEGRSSVTRDEIANYLEQNRVGLNEVSRGGSMEVLNAEAERNFGRPFAELSARDQRDIGRLVGHLDADTATKWSKYSLDPSNPTYRETVLHLPDNADGLRAQFRSLDSRIQAAEYPSIWQQLRGTAPVEDVASLRAQRQDLIERMHRAAGEHFRSGHFPEPNIVGHMMTSMTKHEGRPVYTIDQIQSDWGQKLRDRGVRDEAKIAELRDKAISAERNYEIQKTYIDGGALEAFVTEMRKKYGNVFYNAMDKSEFAKYKDLTTVLDNPNLVALETEAKRLRAELKTAESSIPGHPIVNTTDQWTNTTLRRALAQAVDANADYVAIPSGDTVLGYNPGDTAGMHGFYGRGPRRHVNVGPDLDPAPSALSRSAQEGIVPKNLRKMLLNIDRDHPGGTYVDQLETPSGMRGSGFTMFPLSPAAKEHIRKNGLPLFTTGGAMAIGMGQNAPPQVGNQ